MRKQLEERGGEKKEPATRDGAEVKRLLGGSFKGQEQEVAGSGESFCRFKYTKTLEIKKKRQDFWIRCDATGYVNHLRFCQFFPRNKRVYLLGRVTPAG